MIKILTTNKRRFSFLIIGFCLIAVIIVSGCTTPEEMKPEDTTGNKVNKTTNGDSTLAKEEIKCTAALTSQEDPLFATMARTYNNDMEHTGLFPCAQFSGSMTESNEVVTIESSPDYETGFMVTTLGPEDVYVYGGCDGSANPPALTTYVAKVDPNTLEQIWRTDLTDASQNNQIHLCGSLDALADGSLIAIADHSLYKLDPKTGEIIDELVTPSGDSAPEDVVQNGMAFFADGTIITKTWNRVAGCAQNGIFAMYKCDGALTGEVSPTVLSAIDAETFEVIDSVTLTENIGSRISTTNFEGQDYVYITNTTSWYRYKWDGSKLTFDENWGPVVYASEGQSGGGTPTIMNEWVVGNTMGFTQTMNVAAVSQADDSKFTTIKPNEILPEGKRSTSAAKVMVDPDNNRVYMCDFDLGTCAAMEMINDEFSLLWNVAARTNAMTSLIGPPDARVFVTSNMKSEEPDPTKYNWGSIGANFTEQFLWLDAATGKTLAASDFYSPKTNGSQTPPGYGGVIYGVRTDGHIMKMSPQPAN